MGALPSLAGQDEGPPSAWLGLPLQPEAPARRAAPPASLGQLPGLGTGRKQGSFTL